MPRAPRKTAVSPPSTVAALADALDQISVRVGDSHWRAQCLLASIAPVAITLGEERARALIERLREHSAFLAAGLGHLGEGLARAGQAAAARQALDEARATLTREAIDGERGTLAWRAVALGLDALGEHTACDEALREAIACAGREAQNPTQPWPHVAVALARMGKVDQLISYLDTRLGHTQASFAFADSIEIAVGQLASRGDLPGFERLLDARGSLDGFHLGNALVELAVAGTGDLASLNSLLRRFARHPSYGKDTLVRALVPLAASGHVALARQLLHETAGMLGQSVSFLTTLLSAPPSVEQLTQTGHPDDGVRRTRLGLLLDREATVAALDEAILRAQARAQATPPERDGVLALGNLAMALAANGEAERGAALADEAITGALGLPSHEKSAGLESLGLGCARFGLGAPSRRALGKLTSKHAKVKVGRELARSLVRHKDFAGAVTALEKGAVEPLRVCFGLADGLAQASGQPEPFLRHS